MAEVVEVAPLTTPLYATPWPPPSVTAYTSGTAEDADSERERELEEGESTVLAKEEAEREASLELELEVEEEEEAHAPSRSTAMAAYVPYVASSRSVHGSEQ